MQIQSQIIREGNSSDYRRQINKLSKKCNKKKSHIQCNSFLKYRYVLFQIERGVSNLIAIHV